jgi:hypothetical protein
MIDQAVETENITFGMLSTIAQVAVRLAGRGTFFSLDKTAGIVIVPTDGRARYTCVTGRGVISVRGRTYLIDVNRMYMPEHIDPLEIDRWLVMEGIVDSAPDEYPFRGVYDDMKAAYERFLRVSLV